MSIINKFLLECDDKTVGAYIIIYFVWLQVRVADPDPNLLVRTPSGSGLDLFTLSYIVSCTSRQNKTVICKDS